VPPTGPYSERFLLVTGAGKVSQYVVPAHMRAVVKYISAVNGQAAAALCYVGLSGGTFWLASVPGGNGFVEAFPMGVAYAGEIISLVTNGTSMNASVQGYLLQDPSR
jgi:hypothetical protein